MNPKEMAAVRAVDLVESGMTLGLGTGSTANLFVEELGRRLSDGQLQNIRGIPTSTATARLAELLGIPLVDFSVVSELDMTFDGADEVDPDWNLIKGGGGSLLREKIVAQASKVEVIMVDESKIVSQLGSTFALPVEVDPFGWETQVAFLKSLHGTATLRRSKDGTPFATDGGNFTLDVEFNDAPDGLGLEDPYGLDEQLQRRAGVVETGLFLGITSVLITGAPTKATVQTR